MIAVVTGLLIVIGGAGAIPGAGTAAPTVDNELRFFAVFWIAFGVFAIRVAPHVDIETQVVRALALTLFAGGVARATSWLAVGRPQTLFATLMFVELIGPPLAVAWQAKVSTSS